MKREGEFVLDWIREIIIMFEHMSGGLSPMAILYVLSLVSTESGSYFAMGN